MSCADKDIPPDLNLAHKRRRAGISQERLSDLTGLSVSTIREVEKGKTRKHLPALLEAIERNGQMEIS